MYSGIYTVIMNCPIDSLEYQIELFVAKESPNSPKVLIVVGIVKASHVCKM